MYILDTDVISLMFRFPKQQPLLEQRVIVTPYEHLFITAISVEEAVMGAFKLRDNRNNPVACYSLLAKIPPFYGRFQILPYAAEAIEIYNGFSAQIRRDAPDAGDRKIAAIALHLDYTVITRNIEHYMPTGCKHSNWTRP